MLCNLFSYIIVSLMASNFGARPPLEPKEKPVSARQTAETNDSSSFLAQVSKMNELSLVLSDKLPESGKITTHDVDGAMNDKKSANYNQKGSNDLSIDKSKDAPTDIQNVLTPARHEANGTRSSLESSADQEKKTSEQTSGKNSSGSAKVSDGTSSLAKTSDRADFVESGKSSMCRGSSSTDVSDESSFSSFSSSINKPHKTNDLRWEAIQAVRSKDGSLGLSHFRLLKRLGCGDIGSVYLAELSGTKCYFAMKVMDKASLAGRKKLLRAQTEREILQSLDHPFLPSLYSHFETDKFSCLVMEFCPGGDLHSLRQRQSGKHFSEQAVKYDLFSVFW